MGAHVRVEDIKDEGMQETQDMVEATPEEVEATPPVDETPVSFNDIKEEAQCGADEQKPNAKGSNRPEHKEKVSCPECGKEMTAQGLNYKHKRYCKGKAPVAIEDVAVQEAQQPVKRVAKQQPQIKPTEVQEQPQVVVEPTPEQISNYLKNQRVLKAQKKQTRMQSLAANALP